MVDSCRLSEFRTWLSMLTSTSYYLVGRRSLVASCIGLKCEVLDRVEDNHVAHSHKVDEVRETWSALMELAQVYHPAHDCLQHPADSH